MQGAPAGWTLSPAGLWVTPGVMPAPGRAERSGADRADAAQRAADDPSVLVLPDSARPLERVPSSNESFAQALPGADAARREALAGQLEALTSESVPTLPADDARSGGDRLHRLILGAEESRGALILPADALFSSQRPAPAPADTSTRRTPPASGGRAASSRTLRFSLPGAAAVRPLASGVVPQPAEIRPPGRLKRLLLKPMLWARSVKHYFIDVSVENWREYKAQRERALRADGEVAVADGRALFQDAERLRLPVPEGRDFFADSRVMGMVSGYKTIGSISGTDGFVMREAMQVYDRHFTHPDIPPAARDSFGAFLLRASLYNLGRRSSSLRKQIRKALLRASLARPAELTGFFQALIPPGVGLAAAENQSFDQARTLQAFDAAVRAALAQEALLEPDAARRAVAVVLLGSFASGVATSGSDFDIHVLTGDGSSARVAPFVARLRAEWKDGRHPINAAPFAFPLSREILLEVHREAFLVLSADPALVRNLSPPRGTYDAARTPPDPGWARRAERAAYRGALGLVLRAADLKDRLAAPAPAGARTIDEAAAKKALIGVLASSSLSIAAFILTMVAYAILGQDVVGKQGYTDLRALSSVMSIVLGPLTGMLLGRMTLRTSVAFNTVVRIVSPLAVPLMVYFGALNFWTLFAFSLLTFWNLSSTMIAEGRLIPEITKGKNLAGINALLNIRYFGLNVLLGIFLGWGKIVDFLMDHFGRLEGLSAAFVISAVIHVAVLAIQWFTLPNVRPAAPKKAEPAAESGKDPGARKGLGWTAARWAVLLGAGAGSYLWMHTTIPLVIAAIVGVMTMQAFGRIRRNPVLLSATLLSMLSAFLFYPVNEILIPFMARDLGGGGHLLAQLTGALFFGQLLATSTRLTLRGRLNYAVQAGVMGAMGVWLYFYLFPYNLAALAAGMVLAGGLFLLVSCLTDKGWMRFDGIFKTAGLGLVGLSFVPGFSPAFLMLGVLLIGMGFGPNKVTLDAAYQDEAKKTERAHLGSLMGVLGALVSASIGLGFSATGLVATATPAFPAALLPIGIAFSAAAAFFFFRAARMMKGRIDEKSFRMPGWLERLLPWARQATWVPMGLWARRAIAAFTAGALGLQAAAPLPTRAQALAALEARVRASGIKVIITDYDGTLKAKSKDNKAVPADPGLLDLLKELTRRTGVRLVVSTNHFFAGDDNSITSLFMDRMDPVARAGMLAVVQSGSRLYEYGPAGERPETFLWQETPFDEAERARVTPAFEAAAAAAGLVPADWKLFHEDSRTLIEVRGRQDRLDAVLEALEQANAAGGWGYIIQAKRMPTMRGAPYVQIFKAHKGTGARKAFERLKAAGLVETESQVLILGDDFKEGGNDLYMAEALPGALAVSVGEGTAAARPNVLPWHAPGPESTREVLGKVLEILDPALGPTGG